MEFNRTGWDGIGGDRIGQESMGQDRQDRMSWGEMDR